MEHIIFLLGLPRSGTTLLQRILSVHPEIHSVAEPWLLLPLATCFDDKVNLSVYGHVSLKTALNDLKAEFPSFKEKYDEHVRLFTTKVYDDLRGLQKYFLDKTPRYYLIADELKRIFPSSKFIYLFRSPIEVFDSTIDTFCSDRLYRLPYYYYDMSRGLDLLTQSVGKGCKSHEMQINYEALCSSPEQLVKMICEFLDIEYGEALVSDYMKIKFKGQYGDPKRDMHKGITLSRDSSKPISFIRRRLYMRLIAGISDHALFVSGYERSDLVKQIAKRPVAPITRQFDDLFGYFIFRMSMFVGLPFLLRVRGRQRFDPDEFLF